MTSDAHLEAVAREHALMVGHDPDEMVWIVPERPEMLSRYHGHNVSRIEPQHVPIWQCFLCDANASIWAVERAKEPA